MRILAIAVVALCLGCAGRTVVDVQTSKKEDSRPCRSVEPCSFENTAAGNHAAQAGEYESAVRIFMRCPQLNLPNLVGLIEKYPGVSANLTSLADSLEQEIIPPQVTDELQLLVDVLAALADGERLLRLYNRYLGVGFNRAGDSWVFRDALVRFHYFAEAMESEHGYRQTLRHALKEFHVADDKSSLSSAGIFLSGSVESYALPLVGLGRVDDAACVIDLYRRTSHFVTSEELSQMITSVCEAHESTEECEREVGLRLSQPEKCESWQTAFANGE